MNNTADIADCDHQAGGWGLTAVAIIDHDMNKDEQPPYMR